MSSPLPSRTATSRHQSQLGVDGLAVADLIDDMLQWGRRPNVEVRSRVGRVQFEPRFQAS
jgi:hypothetical protein